MELYDFNCSSKSRRTALVWAHGHFIMLRQVGGYRVCLYHMGNFFAEVWYQVEDNQLKLVIGFKNISHLEPYLERVDLSDIIA